ncbi:MAG: hypothetical protein ABI051_13240 [Vicinamibacterales bacterium]
MNSAAEPIRQLTRAYIGARVHQGLLFWFVLLHNVNAMLYPNPRLRMWLSLGAILAAATLGSFYQWRFGRVEPRKRSLGRQAARATVFALLLVVVVMASVAITEEVGGTPTDLIWALLSTVTAASLAFSRGDRLGWVVPLLASLGLLVTLVVPSLQPFRQFGHAGMAAALIVTAVQLHLFVVRRFRHAAV